MKLQSGWPIYAFMGLLSMLSLLSLRPMQRPQEIEQASRAKQPVPSTVPNRFYPSTPRYDVKWPSGFDRLPLHPPTAQLKPLGVSGLEVWLGDSHRRWLATATQQTSLASMLIGEFAGEASVHPALVSSLDRALQNDSPAASTTQLFAAYREFSDRQLEQLLCDRWQDWQLAANWLGQLSASHQGRDLANVAIGLETDCSEPSIRFAQVANLFRPASTNARLWRDHIADESRTWQAWMGSLASSQEFSNLAALLNSAAEVKAADDAGSSAQVASNPSPSILHQTSNSTVTNDAPTHLSLEQLVRRTAPATWPYAEHLGRRILALPAPSGTHHVAFKQWQLAVLTDLDRLSHRSSLIALDVRQDLGELMRRFTELDAILAEVPIDQNPKELRATRYDLAKWIAIWTLIHETANEQHEASTRIDSSLVSSKNHSQVLSAIAATKKRLSGDLNSKSWIEFFELNALEAAYSSEGFPVVRRQATDRVLTRLEMAQADTAQRRLLEDATVQELRRSLLLASVVESTNLSELLYYLEVYEQEPWTAVGTKVLARSRRLQRDEGEAARQLAQLIDTHYRNANFRISVSESFLNRLVPEQEPISDTVSDEILGARVFGHSETVNHLAINLRPHPTQLHIELQAEGSIDSRTRASKGPFVFHNRGLGRFSASKALLIGHDRLRLQPTQVAASSRNQTIDVQSDFDILPLLGPLARSLASQQQREKAPMTRRIVERKIESQARERIDAEFETRIAEAEQRFAEGLLGPLDRFQLQLEPIEHRTTEERMIVRYRLAGDDQLSGFTARPRALSDSEVSMQLHQSVANNLLRRLQLEGKTFAVAELYEYLSEMMGREIPAPDDIDPNVEFTFASSDCIELRFEEGNLSITVRFRNLQIGRHTSWRNLAVTADYQPQLRGLELEFRRAPGSTLRLQGRGLGFREQMSIRTIFNKVFDDQKSLPATPDSMLTDARFEELSVSQCEIRDGWVGLSFESQ